MIIRHIVRVVATQAVTRLRCTRVVDNYIFVVVVVVVVAVVVIFCRNCRTLDCEAAAKERSEWIADLAADVRVRQIETDVDECSQVIIARLFIAVRVYTVTQ